VTASEATKSTTTPDPVSAITVRLVGIAAVSVVVSESLCLILYAVLGLPIDLSTSIGWVMILAPSVTPAIVAPVVSIPMARQRNRLLRSLAETDEARRRLEHEVTERRAIQERLEFHVRHDPLTQVLNRRGFFEHVRDSTAGPRGLLVVDVDEFKLVNDRCGHSGGDRLLCTIAERLHHAAGPQAMVARLGGDEFVALLPTADEALADAVRVSLATLTVEALDGTTMFVSASVGSATVRSADAIDDALAEADEKMYAVKRRRYRGSTSRS
jgi:diguanylate cyclase (GGDEF)-like protein